MASQPGRADGAPQYPLLGTSGTHQSIPEESDDEERDTPQGNVWLNQESVVSYQCPHRVLRQVRHAAQHNCSAQLLDVRAARGCRRLQCHVW